MAERGGQQSPGIPEPDEIIKAISEELGLDPKKKPAWREEYPEQPFFPEEAPTPDGRYMAGACVEEIYNLTLRNTQPGRRSGAQSLIAPRDVRLVHRQFRQIVEDAWQASDLEEPFPDFTLTHLLGAAKRQIAHLLDQKCYHESEMFDPALGTFQTIAFVVERAISDSDPDPQYLGEGAP